MAYSNTDYAFWDNPKIIAAGKDAALLYLAGNGYCNQFLTDGFLDDAIVANVAFRAFQRQPKKAIDALVANKLWIRVEGGYQVHDYLKHNKSKAQVDELRNKNSAAGKASAQARVQANAQATVQHSVEQSVEQSVEHGVEKVFNHISYSLTNDKELPPPQEVTRAGEIFKVYENEIGVITPSVADSIKSALEDYPFDWFKVAMKEAAMNNKRNWRYVEAILKRWKVDGFQVDTRQKQPKTQYAPKSVNPGLDAVKAEMERMGMEFTGIFAKEESNG